MLLYIVRHGDPNYETDSLTERGLLQAEAVGKRIAASKIDRIFASPMGRARQTAAPAARLLGLDVTIEDWAHEIEEERLTPFPDGKIKSVTYVENTLYRNNGSVNIPYEREFEAPGFNESGMKTAVERIERGGREFLSRLGYEEEGGVWRIVKPNDEKIALFCHTAMGRAWISRLLHIPIHIMWSGFSYTHTGVTIIEFKNNESGFCAPKLLCFSDTSHLYSHGPDMIYDNSYEI